MRERPATRRRFLAGLSVGALGSIAGCSGIGRGQEYADEYYFAPRISQNLLNGWELVEEDTQSMVQTYDLVVTDYSVYGLATIRRYEDSRLRGELREGTMGQFDNTIRAFAASKINIVPSFDELPLGIGRGEIMDLIETQSIAQFENQLRQQGLSSVRQTDSGSIEVHGGNDADAFVFGAIFSQDIPAFEGVNGRSIDFGRVNLPIQGMLAIWHDGENALVAGGAYPADNFTRSVDQDLTDMVEVTVSIDLGLDPAQYRDDLIDMIQSVR